MPFSSCQGGSGGLGLPVRRSASSDSLLGLDLGGDDSNGRDSAAEASGDDPAAARLRALDGALQVREGGE